jgi:hypothetical protein
MRKIPGVKTVKVSLNEGLTVLDLNPSNVVTLGQLRTVLKNSGFVAREAKVEAGGTAAVTAQTLVFTVAGSGETFTVLPGLTNRSAYEDLNRRVQAGPVAVQLKAIASAPDGKTPSLAVDVAQ